MLLNESGHYCRRGRSILLHILRERARSERKRAQNRSTRTKWERAQIQKIFLLARTGQNQDEITETDY